MFGFNFFLITAIIGIIWFNFAYSLYAHRIISHNHFDISATAHRVFGFMFCCLNFGSTAMFAAVHKRHHKYSGSDLDPHNPKRIGIIKAMFKLWDAKYIPDYKVLKSLLRNEILLKDHKNHFYIAIVSGVIFPFIQVIAFWLSNILLILVHSGKGVEDYINIPVLKPILWGEELHRNHHMLPKNKNHNIHNTWLELDLLYYIGNLVKL